MSSSQTANGSSAAIRRSARSPKKKQPTPRETATAAGKAKSRANVRADSGSVNSASDDDEIVEIESSPSPASPPPAPARAPRRKGYQAPEPEIVETEDSSCGSLGSLPEEVVAAEAKTNGRHEDEEDDDVQTIQTDDSEVQEVVLSEDEVDEVERVAVRDVLRNSTQRPVNFKEFAHQVASNLRLVDGRNAVAVDEKSIR